MNNKLDLPYISVVPFKVLSNKNITPMAKLFYGCLVALSIKSGYCWATDTQLAEQHEVDERTIKRWLSELEKEKFISRETKNFLKNEGAERRWVKIRKIHVSNGFSNNDCERDKNVPSNGRDKNVPSTSINSKEITTTPTPPSKPKAKKEEVVVVFKSLEKIKISDDLKASIRAKDYTELEIDLAVKRCLAWKGRQNDEIGILTALKKAKSWTDTANKEDVEDENTEFLKSMKHLDGKVVFNHLISILSSEIHLSCGNYSDVFSTEQHDFKKKFTEKYEKLKAAEVNQGSKR